MVKRVLRNCTPLCYMPNGSLLCYQPGHIILLQDGEMTVKYPIKVNAKERFWGWNRYIVRLFRLGIRSAFAIDNDHVVISKGNMLFEFNLTNGELSKGWCCGMGIRPLSFTNVKDINGFDNGLYFGGYLGNRTKAPVSIYKRTGIDQWHIVYTFPQGTINHVHNIVADTFRNCLWVFTGDFDNASAIWRITNNFKNVECLASNDQKFRGCVAYALPEGLLYATDAPFADDFIYLLNPETKETKEIYPIHGSCIYGCKWKDKYVFSSTVEGDGRTTSRIEFLFGRKRGAGIKDDYVHIYIGNLNEGFTEMYKEKKDCMPYYTFQFGVFKFPAGVNNSDTLYFQPTATKKNDLRMLKMMVK